MAAINWANVTDEAPELATGISTNAQTVLLDYANTKIDPAGYDGEDGRKTFLARVYWVAHTSTMLKRKGLAGTRTAQSAGPVSESFTLLQLPWLGVYSTTSYGVLFASISQSSAHRAGQVLRKPVFPAGTGGRNGWGC